LNPSLQPKFHAALVISVSTIVECIHFQFLKRIQIRTHPKLTQVDTLCQHSKNCAKISKL
jgi:hypothetical protein